MRWSSEDPSTWPRQRLPAEYFVGELHRRRAAGAKYRDLAAATGLSLGLVHRLVNKPDAMWIDPATQDRLRELESDSAR